MKNNTMSIHSYRFYCILWLFFGAFWYYKRLFRPIRDLSLFDSGGILLAVFAGFAFFGLLINGRAHRNCWSIFASVALSLGFCAIITYYALMRKQILAAVSAGLLLSLAYAVYLLTYRVKNRDNLGEILRKRLKQAYFAGRFIMACCASVLVVYLFVSAAFGILVFAPPERVGTPPEDLTIEGNMETIAKLDEEVWAGLDTGERLRILQTMADIEAYYFGIPVDLIVVSDALRENTYATYNDKTHTISIDTAHLENDSAHSVLRSLCHEARHAYQHRLCDLYDSVSEEQQQLLLFYDARSFKEDFLDYIDGNTDEFGYYVQDCEIDARNYAEYAAAQYYAAIDDYREQ